MQNIVIRSEVTEIQFGLYSDEQIHQLSCCQISSPIAFDGLGNPINNGLYDPKLGPTTQYGPPCVTCGQVYMNCPGHPGHIDLCVPVYHPLLFAKMFALLRAQCAHCHHFRASKTKVRLALTKLMLTEMGMVTECNQLDDLFIPPAVFTDSLEDSATHIEDGHKKLDEYEATYKKFVDQKTSNSNSSTISQQRMILDAFQKASVAVKICESCGAFSPKLRKDGYTKLFEKPLLKKQRASMAANKIKLKPALEKLQNSRGGGGGDDSDEEQEKAQEQEQDDDEGDSKISDTDKYLAPIEIEARMKYLWQAHPEFLDFIWSRPALTRLTFSQNAPSDLWKTFFIQAVLVPPSRFRPPADLGDVQSEHPQNLSLAKILSINEKINQIRTISNEAVSNRPDGTTIDISKLIGVWIDLQNAVNCFIDSTKDQNVRPDDAVSGIRQILEKKEGLFRRHMMGKRVNYCCRSVISPDPFLGMNEIGIPVQFAKELQYPTPVTSWNVKMLRQMVENGPSIYPGANQIEKADGTIIKLDRFSQQERIAKAKLLLSDPGIKVYRHLISGDMLLVNRQPTLHKPGIMAHKARVLQHVREQTLRMNYANCNAYNADFDGDEMNCHFVQNEIARAEATYICNTENQYIAPTSGGPLRGLIQDHVASGVKLTCKDTFLTLEEFQQLLYITVTGLPGTEVVSNFEEITIPPPTILKPVKLWTGKQVITALLRLLCRPPLPSLHLDAKSRTPPTAFGVAAQEHIVIFRFGELLCGVLDKNAIGNSSLGIVHAIYELYGSELAGLVLSAFSRLFTYHLQNAGHTCGVEDLTLTAASDDIRKKLLAKVQIDSEIGIQKFLDSAAGIVPTNIGSGGFTSLERSRCEKRVAHLLQSDKIEGKVKLDGAVQSVVNKSASDILKACLPSGLEVQFPRNNFSMMVLTGAKGSAVNQSQISCFLGQQALEGQRVPMMISGKTLPSFKPYDSGIRAGGFVADRFLTGVRPQEYYFHCMAGREGLVDTAVKTSRSGYLQRCLIKHLEELRVNYDLTVRDSSGSVIQFLYGEDGLDPLSAGLLNGKSNELLFLSRNHHALVHKYSVHGNFFEQGLEVEAAKLHHQYYTAANKTIQSLNGVTPPHAKYSKHDVLFARKKLNNDRPWSRYNMKKKWFLAEIIKVRKPSSSRSSSPILPYTSYDIRYVDDNTVEKRVPANMRVKATPLVVDNGELQPEKNALIPLIRPGLPDPVMSLLGVSNNVGAVSENIQKKIREYINENPDGIISDTTSETRVIGDGLELLVWIKYLRSLACPGEAVGCVAAQSVGEPSTQMTLNTFHLAGHGGANVTLGIPRLREIIMTASKSLKTPTMTIPLVKGQTNETAKLLALRFSRVPLSKLLHHSKGIEVGERIVRDKSSGIWERIYRVRFHFENPKLIKSAFGVTFAELIQVLQTTVVKKLHSIVQLEYRRARAASKQTVVIKNTSTPKFGQKSTEGGGDGDGEGAGDEEMKTSTKKNAKELDGIDSDAEDGGDGEDDEVDDDEQGTLKLGSRPEVNGYQEDSDGDNEEEKVGVNEGDEEKEKEDDDEDEDDEEADMASSDDEDNSQPAAKSALDAVEDALKKLQAASQRSKGYQLPKKKTESKKETSKEFVGRIGNGRIVDASGTVQSNEIEGWVELNVAFPAHSRKLLMVQLAEQACGKSSVRETKSIANAYPTECEVDGEKRFAIQLEGVNFEAAWDLPETIAEVNHIQSNDIWKVLCTYGVEAARQSIVSEITSVFGVYGINVNSRHLSLIADFMTRSGSYVPMNRMAMMDCPSRFLQMSFETTATFLTQAALEGGVETLESPSARIVTGGVPRVGTGCFDIMLPL